jgi:CTP:molybdopterin cytidylyltransferase MocA
MTRAASARGSGVACAILAAGASRRLGRPKQLLNVASDQPLIRHIASIALSSRADAVAVVLGAHAGAIAAALAGLPAVELIRIADWPEGMSASVRAAATWAAAQGWGALLLAVSDQARLTARHLDDLIDASEQGRLLAASYYGGVRGVPAVIPGAHYGALQRLTGDQGARALLRSGQHPVVEIGWDAGLEDLDEVGDLA